jgi:hypothetical protein
LFLEFLTTDHHVVMCAMKGGIAIGKGGEEVLFLRVEK